MRAMGKRRFAVAACLIAYLAAANPVLTGIPIHEWAGLGLLIAFLVHAAMHVDWMVDTFTASFDGPPWARIGHFVLDALMVAVFATATVSGLLISGSVLQAFGLYAPGYYFWGPLHAVSAKVLMAFLIVHLVVHARWIAGFIRGLKGEHHGDRDDR